MRSRNYNVSEYLQKSTKYSFERILLASSCLLSPRRSLSGIEPVGASQSKNDKDIAWDALTKRHLFQILQVLTHYEAQSARHEANNGSEESRYYPKYCSYNILCERKDGCSNCKDTLEESREYGEYPMEQILE